MIHAKNYETVSNFVKVMPRIPWPLFFPGHGVYRPYDADIGRGDNVTASYGLLQMPVAFRHINKLIKPNKFIQIIIFPRQVGRQATK